MDFSNHGAEETLKWVLGLSASPPSSLFIKLHIGDPGVDGTANAAVNTTRQAVSFSAPVVDGGSGKFTADTSADVVWLAVAASETYSHISIWDAVTAGDCWYKGDMVTPVPVIAGGTFTFPAGEKISHD